MSRDLEDLETGKYEFHIPGETPKPARKPAPLTKPAEPEPEPEPVAEEPQEAPEEKPQKEPVRAHEEEEPEEAEEEVRIATFFRFIIRLAVAAVLLYGLFTYVLAVFSSYDDRMDPFIKNGDIVVALRLTSYSDGDAVLYRNPDTGNTAISRIAATGTNTIDISGAGEVQINGNASTLTVYETTPKAHTAGISYPYQMTDSGYFLLNDHRLIEIDSRQFGQVEKDRLIGKVILVIRWKGF